MISTLVTGFSPFNGRQVNASWIAAQSLVSETGLRLLEIPVVWGEPMTQLDQVCREQCPELIISMGEGRECWFDIETLARNRRAARPDNEGRLPQDGPIIPAGPAETSASIDAPALQQRLLAQNFPVRISRDAGGFLCEETFYTLEILRDRYPRIVTVVFVHLPPFGTKVNMDRFQTVCTEAVLAEFAHALLDAVTEMHVRSSNRPDKRSIGAAWEDETDSLGEQIRHTT